MNCSYQGCKRRFYEAGTEKRATAKSTAKRADSAAKKITEQPAQSRQDGTTKRRTEQPVQRQPEPTDGFEYIDLVEEEK